MNKNAKLLVVAIFATLFAAFGCAGMFAPQAQVWPQAISPENIYFVPQKMASVDEAIGTIKNEQKNFVEYYTGGPLMSLDADQYGMRANWEYTVTTEKPQPFIYFGPTQYVTETHKDSLVVPFADVNSITLWHMPVMQNFSWQLLIGINKSEPVYLRAKDEESMMRLANAIATISMERGVIFPKFWFGCGTVPVKPELSTALNIPPGTGLVVLSVGTNSSAAKSGIKLYDVLLEFDGAPLNTRDDLAHALSSASKAGEKVAKVKLITTEGSGNVLIDKNYMPTKAVTKGSHIQTIRDVTLIY